MLIDDEEHIRVAASQALDLAGYRVHAFDRGERALAALTADWPGAVISDIRMPGIDGMQFLQRAGMIDPDLPVILITGHGDVSMAVEAMRAGAYDFLEKPCPPQRLIEVAATVELDALLIERGVRVSALGGSLARAVTLVESDAETVTVLDLFRFAYETHHDVQQLRRFLGAPIAERVRAKIEQKLANL